MCFYFQIFNFVKTDGFGEIVFYIVAFGLLCRRTTVQFYVRVASNFFLWREKKQLDLEAKKPIV